MKIGKRLLPKGLIICMVIFGAVFGVGTTIALGATNAISVQHQANGVTALDWRAVVGEGN